MPKCVPPSTPDMSFLFPEKWDMPAYCEGLEFFEVEQETRGACLVMRLNTTDRVSPRTEKIGTFMLSAPAAMQLPKAPKQAVKEHLNHVRPDEPA